MHGLSVLIEYFSIMDKKSEIQMIDPQSLYPHISVIVMRGYIEYLELKVGIEGTSKFLNNIGIPWEYLQKDTNWLSVASSARLIEGMSDLPGVESDFSYQAAYLVVTSQRRSLLHELALKFSSPQQVYEFCPKITKRTNKLDKLQILNKNENGISYILALGNNPLRLDFIYENWRGFFENIPLIFNLPRNTCSVIQLCESELIFEVKFSLQMKARKRKGLLQRIYRFLTQNTLTNFESESFGSYDTLLQAGEDRYAELYNHKIEQDHRLKEALIIADLVRTISAPANDRDFISETLIKMQSSFDLQSVAIFKYDSGESSLELFQETGGLLSTDLKLPIRTPQELNAIYLAHALSPFGSPLCKPIASGSYFFGFLVVFSNQNSENPSASTTETEVNTSGKVSDTFVEMVASQLGISLESRNLRILEVEQQKKEAQIQLGALAQQVAHDIRSPLAALNVAIDHTQMIEEDYRLIIRNATDRIRDIAHDLITRANRKSDSSEVTETHDAQPTVQLLSALVESVISEKRIQYRQRLDVDIEFTQTCESYGIFSSVGVSDLKRVISNLINNSVEAIVKKGRGKVQIFLSTRDEANIIEIHDNGPGISPDILTKLGNRGITQGKKGGTGLGLYHARETLKKWGGTLDLRSTPGHGATVTLVLPQASAPSWFVPKLEMQDQAKTQVVIVDDDSSIHHIWKGRFEEKVKQGAIQLIHCAGEDELNHWVNEHGTQDSDTKSSRLFLIDFEFLGKQTNGLDIIQRFGIIGDSILVTSRFEDPKIIEKCEQLNVRLIPKGMVGFVPL